MILLDPRELCWTGVLSPRLSLEIPLQGYGNPLTGAWKFNMDMKLGLIAVGICIEIVEINRMLFTSKQNTHKSST